jgi:hypothetical protein
VLKNFKIKKTELGNVSGLVGYLARFELAPWVPGTAFLFLPTRNTTCSKYKRFDVPLALDSVQLQSLPFTDNLVILFLQNIYIPIG